MAVRIPSNSGPQALAAASIARRSPLDITRQAIAKRPVARTRSQVESARRAIARAQAQEVKGQIREKALARIDVLVEGMGALAEKMSSKKVSSSQRSVLMSRFNDLQRQVNRIDGIVGAEGRETQGQKGLNRSPSEARGRTENHQEAIPSQPEIRAVRQTIQSERRTVARTRQQAQQTIERELQSLRPEAGKPEPEWVQETLNGIRSQGLSGVGDQAGGNLVDLQV